MSRQAATIEIRRAADALQMALPARLNLIFRGVEVGSLQCNPSGLALDVDIPAK